MKLLIVLAFLFSLTAFVGTAYNDYRITHLSIPPNFTDEITKIGSHIETLESQILILRCVQAGGAYSPWEYSTIPGDTHGIEISEPNCKLHGDYYSENNGTWVSQSTKTL